MKCQTLLERPHLYSTEHWLTAARNCVLTTGPCLPSAVRRPTELSAGLTGPGPSVCMCDLSRVQHCELSQSEVIMSTTHMRLLRRYCGEGRGICRNKYKYLETILTSSVLPVCMTSSDEELPTSPYLLTSPSGQLTQLSNLLICRAAALKQKLK